MCAVSINMSETYKKFCNSMDAYPPMAAFTAGVVGMIILLASFIIKSFSFIPKSALNNMSSAFFVVGLLLICVPCFVLGVYPLFRLSI